MNKDKYKYSQLEKVELSLIIDQENFIIVEIDLKNVSDQEINKVCSSICLKYDLPKSVNKKLFSQILKEINEILKEKEKELQKEIKEKELVNRLYYESIEYNNKKLLHIENIKKELNEKNIKSLSFTPHMGKNINNYLRNRNHYKIEERLYYEDKEIKESKKYEKVLSDLAIRKGNSKENKSSNKISKIKNNKSKDKIILKNHELNKDNNFSNKNTIQNCESILNNKILNTCINTVNKTENEEMENSLKNPRFISTSATKNSMQNFPTNMNINISTSHKNPKSNSIYNNQIIPSNSNDNMYLLTGLNSNNFTLNHLHKGSNKKDNENSNYFKRNSYCEKYERILSKKNQQNSNNVTLNQVSVPMSPSTKNKNTDVISIANLKSEFEESKRGENEENKKKIFKKVKNITKSLLNNKIDDSLTKDFSLVYNEDEIKHTQKSDIEKNKESSLTKSLDRERNKNKKNAFSCSPRKKLNKYDNLCNTEPDEFSKRHQKVIKELKMQCPFRPELSKETIRIIGKIRKPENKNQFVNRLTNYKKVKSLLLGSKLLNLSRSFSPSRSSKYINTVCNTSSNLNQKSKYTLNDKKTALDMHDSDTQHIYLQTTVESADKSYNRHRPGKLTIREMKSERNLYGDFDKIKDEKKKTNKLFHQKFNENINKFKLNNLKHLYECIIKNNHDLNIHSIPVHIRDRLVIPTCTIIKSKGLEFNFHNFYSISSELLKKFF